ncbi:hypothetical protein AVV40_gp06 [Mycobacterium phage Swirley]|uniref:Uncharacterized protein n=2 Tax=Benedictvirus TaxID=2946819 RepID=A0A076YN02_9CAUD|nr:hypothetical protein AVV40_gp06 [Mycobacterium phage Swirley]YP_009638174.1 hypothetical protein FGG35_gp06 [Mycobacterium phage Cuco]AVR76667.1 hypothetical protein SEA_COOG_85 [Mycobacterium phage Coog]AVR77212.1 hypothetical protein SEA_MIDAS2_85 [Mycobacterium phage Midas2]AXC33911.1 hypothetical protein SEA_TARYNEARAL_90 [Mycobacterium phage Tarynearal]AEL17681.1 hypothetical protein CUCO_87 [Mycobacterium phage Cuco]AIK68953.1 hypothetical protein PBI_SWIRLEY_88 [Mycobacterium phage 
MTTTAAPTPAPAPRARKLPRLPRVGETITYRRFGRADAEVTGTVVRVYGTGTHYVTLQTSPRETNTCDWARMSEWMV